MIHRQVSHINQSNAFVGLGQSCKIMVSLNS